MVVTNIPPGPRENHARKSLNNKQPDLDNKMHRAKVLHDVSRKSQEGKEVSEHTPVIIIDNVMKDAPNRQQSIRAEILHIHVQYVTTPHRKSIQPSAYICIHLPGGRPR
jgi:hypothetical protein